MHFEAARHRCLKLQIAPQNLKKNLSFFLIKLFKETTKKNLQNKRSKKEQEEQ